MSTAPAHLDYGRPNTVLTRRRARWIVVGVIVLALTATALWQRRRIEQWRRQAETLYFQRSCLNFTVPPTQVVYEDNPARVGDLTRSADSTMADGHTREVRLSNGHSVFLWDHYLFTHLWVRAGPIPPGEKGVLFLHERFTPAGERFILGCIVVPNVSGNWVEFQLHEFRPATWSTRIVRRNALTTTLPEINRALAAGRHVRLYAGQPDPRDRTHFTIRCEIDGVEETLDGWEGNRTTNASGVPTPGLRLQMRPRTH
jgi:hypothetical protein